MEVEPRISALLVVEDSDEDFDTVCEGLHRLGLKYRVVRARTGGECLDLLRNPATPLRPDFVLLDLNTPGIDGREALEAIKADAELKKLPVVVFSTSGDPRDRDSCYMTGANAYHMKPLRYPEHVAVVEDLILYWSKRVELPEWKDSSS